ncbi:hypothetical protein ACJIZ3_003742 [Penstemon smallii]|uniref:Uncharacterized protein n=1 Tax=Penstemon smallii TaxID=265156 RepID=A0ABD3UA19_9LAMI
MRKQNTIPQITGHLKLAMQKRPAQPNGDQFSHGTSLQTSQFNGSKDTTTVEKQKAIGQQKLAMQKKLFFDNIEIGSPIALFCFGLPKSIVAEGLLLTRGDDNGFCKVYIKKVLVPHEKVKFDKNGLTVGEAEDKCVLWDIANCNKHHHVFSYEKRGVTNAYIT